MRWKLPTLVLAISFAFQLVGSTSGAAPLLRRLPQSAGRVPRESVDLIQIGTNRAPLFTIDASALGIDGTALPATAPALNLKPELEGAGRALTPNSAVAIDVLEARALSSALGFGLNFPSRSLTARIPAPESNPYADWGLAAVIPLPEPASLLLLIIGIITGVGGLWARRQLQSRSVAWENANPSG